MAFIDPYRKVRIGARDYDYAQETWRVSHDVLANHNHTLGSNTVQTTGLGKGSHTLQIILQTGSTVSGLSNTAHDLLQELLGVWGASRYTIGLSLPLIFIAPSGVTYSVAPVGSLNYQEFLGSPGESRGVEYRVDLSVQEV